MVKSAPPVELCRRRLWTCTGVEEIGPAEKAEDDAEDEALEASPTPGVDGLGYDLEGNALGVP